jgi:hypothetical protein
MATLIKDMKKREHCHDCGTSLGMQHVDGCDVEACTECGLQRISCGCDSDSRETWSGLHHERIMRICEEQNLYTKWSSGEGWVPAEKGDPESTHDLNRGAQVLMNKRDD